MIPSILGDSIEVGAGAPPRVSLRSGRVTSPVPPGDPAFDAYVQRCLRTWSVDVELESGEYVIGCRLMTTQGNSREGIRRMPRLPSIGEGAAVIPGDLVVVGFLNGSIEAGLVLGYFNPSIHSSVSADDLEQSQMTSRRADEVQERYEHSDLSDPTGPAITSVVTRNDGLNLEREHGGEMLVNGVRLSSMHLERHVGGRNIDTEQMVSVDPTTKATIRTSNTAASDLRSMHAVQGPDGLSVVAYQDLQAQVIQLTHQVKELSKLVVSSDKAERLLVQHETPKLVTTMISDSDSRTVQMLAEDVAAKTKGGWSVGPKGEVLLRRLDASGKETIIQLNEDNTLTIQVPSGPTIYLDESDVLVTSGGSSITVSEDDGISLITKGGTMITAQDDAVVVSGDACTIATQSVHLKTGGLLVGASQAGAQRVPSAERLLARMIQVETALKTLALWCRTHTHPVAGTAAAPSTLVLSPSASPSGLFNLVTDTIKSIKGV